MSVDRAKAFARKAHEGQVDKMGRPYFEHHLEGVAQRLRPNGADAEMAGYLHDILEDTDVTTDDLRAQGCPENVIRAVESVSKIEGETYDQLIDRAGADPLGVEVKLADNAQNLEDNPALAKVDPIKAAKLSTKYETARRALLEAKARHAAGGLS